MNFLVRLALIVVALGLVYYVISQYYSMNALPILNDGEVTIKLPQVNSPTFKQEAPSD